MFLIANSAAAIFETATADASIRQRKPERERRIFGRTGGSFGCETAELLRGTATI
jgi:hypothetical protein